METPTYNCYIHSETNTTYTVEVDCRCGKIHNHGIEKDEINKASHRVADCLNFPNGYYILLTQKEISRWKKDKK